MDKDCKRSTSGACGLYDQNLDNLSLSPPCIQLWNIVLWPLYFARSAKMKDVNQNNELAGFSSDTEIPRRINTSI